MATKKDIKDKQRAGFKSDLDELNAKIKKDSVKRYAYLLGQTDIFGIKLNLT
jgi:hypothetical protein